MSTNIAQHHFHNSVSDTYAQHKNSLLIMLVSMCMYVLYEVIKSQAYSILIHIPSCVALRSGNRFQNVTHVLSHNSW